MKKKIVILMALGFGVVTLFYLGEPLRKESLESKGTSPVLQRRINSATYDFRVDLSEPPTNITFGSCNDLREIPGQEHWNHVVSLHPNAWIWNGDIVYPDSDPEFEAAFERWSKTGDTTALDEMEAIRREHFRMLKTNENYERLVKTTSVFGVWDDHDYGHDDADGRYPRKNESRATVLEFLGVSEGNPVRDRAGLYQSVRVGNADSVVHLIVLDLRYFMDFQKGILLGPEQWSWLEGQVRNSDADVVVLFTSLVFENEVPPKDTWSDFPAEQKRLRVLVQGSERPLLVVSGDLHYASFTEYGEGGKKGLEFTSSGITHVRDSWKLTYWSLAQFFGGHKVDKKIAKKNFGEMVFRWDPSGQIESVEARARSAATGEILKQEKVDLK